MGERVFEAQHRLNGSNRQEIGNRQQPILVRASAYPALHPQYPRGLRFTKEMSLCGVSRLRRLLLGTSYAMG